MDQEWAPERPIPAVGHAIGADLSAVSVDELRERVRLLQAEIVRIEDEVRRKEHSRDAAASFFRS